MPKPELIALVDCWNNSPKLASSGNSLKSRYEPIILEKLSSLKNSWFKFVITSWDDWREIEMDYLCTSFIKDSQIILMPQGETREELEQNREKVLEIAIFQGMRYSSREHITIWDEKTGV